MWDVKWRSDSFQFLVFSCEKDTVDKKKGTEMGHV